MKGETEAERGTRSRQSRFPLFRCSFRYRRPPYKVNDNIVRQDSLIVFTTYKNPLGVDLLWDCGRIKSSEKVEGLTLLRYIPGVNRCNVRCASAVPTLYLRCARDLPASCLRIVCDVPAMSRRAVIYLRCT